MVSARCSETLAALAAALTARHWTLATAESCTGGLIGAAITDLPGASAYFLGGIIAYDNRIKNQLLGVPETILAAHGAVSAQTVEAMAAGARRQLSADCAIAVSGVAGPDGGTPEKPVGLVYIGWALPGTLFSRRFLFTGDRAAIRQATVETAVGELLQAITAR
jgi:PncC family amidohydrolase